MNKIQFSFAEQHTHKAIAKLQDDWYKALSSINSECAALFCSDGFYPYYFSQECKVLFIGREPVSMSGCDYIEELYNAYHRGDVGGRSLAAHQFHKRLLYLTYGLQYNGKIAFDNLPNIMELGKTFATKEGVSFAFIELSKYSNDGDDATDHRNLNLMTAFLQDTISTNRKFMQEEIALLQPDIIIGMNLWDAGLNENLIASVLGETKFVSDVGKPAAILCSLDVQGKQIPFVDMYHFSSRKETKVAFYEPLMRVWKTRRLLSSNC